MALNFILCKLTSVPVFFLENQFSISPHTFFAFDWLADTKAQRI